MTSETKKLCLDLTLFCHFVKCASQMRPASTPCRLRRAPAEGTYGPCRRRTCIVLRKAGENGGCWRPHRPAWAGRSSQHAASPIAARSITHRSALHRPLQRTPSTIRPWLDDEGSLQDSFGRDAVRGKSSTRRGAHSPLGMCASRLFSQLSLCSHLTSTLAGAGVPPKCFTFGRVGNWRSRSALT